MFAPVGAVMVKDPGGLPQAVCTIVKDGAAGAPGTAFTVSAVADETHPVLLSLAVTL